jgi:hypothetical protein
MIAVDSQTPNILYYQCSSHANMGNHTFATSPVVNTGVFLTLPTADGSSGQVVTTNGSGVLSFANGSVPDDAITLAKMAPGTDGNIISYDASGNPVAVATGSAAQVLTSAGAGAVPSFQTATVPDDAITLAKMAPGTDGNIISYDASGNPVAVATGSSGQVLTSAGAGAVPSFQAAAAGGKLLQLVHGITTTAVTHVSNGGQVDTGLTATITPTASNSTILVLISQNNKIQRGGANSLEYDLRLFRGSSEVEKWPNVCAEEVQGSSLYGSNHCYNYLDSPSSTSQLVYKTTGQIVSSGGGRTVAFQNSSAPSTMTLMEIGA